MKNVMTMTAAALLLTAAAHAQMTVTQTQTHTQTHVQGTVPSQGANGITWDNPVQATESTVTRTESTTVGAAPTVDPGAFATVKLESGEMVRFPDTGDKSWQDYAREKGYNRFTFDPVSGLFVVGKGEARYEGRWQTYGETGNSTGGNAGAGM